MCNIVRACVLTTLWVVAIFLMSLWTAMGADTEHLAMLGWSILIAMIGSCVAGWQMISLERMRVEDIAKLAARRALEHRGPQAVD